MSRDTERADHETRLSRITTQWSLVAQAHTSGDERTVASRQALLERYVAASYRYLLGAVHDEDAAEEILGDFAVRFLQGDFHRAAPERGRFRNYLKKALINLVNDYRRSLQRRPRALPEGAQIGAPSPAHQAEERHFEECLREELLRCTWAALEQANPTYHLVLHARVFQPDLSSREIAEQLNHRLGKRVTADTVRKALARARGKFAELLLQEVARACDARDASELKDELQQLNLLKYCQSALDGWRPGR